MSKLIIIWLRTSICMSSLGTVLVNHISKLPFLLTIFMQMRMTCWLLLPTTVQWRFTSANCSFDLESAMEAVKVTLPPVHAFAHWLELGDDEHRHQWLEDCSLSGH